MAFWNRKSESRAATSGMANPMSWMLDDFTNGASSPSGKKVTVQTAIGLAPVWAAVSLISEQVGQLPLKVYREVDGERIEARQHRAWSLLHDKPNEHTPADRFWSTLTTQILLYGNAFIRKHRDSMNLVDELTLLNPSHMLVYWDGDQRIKEYRYQPLNGQLQTYGPDEVCHVFSMSLDGVIGESVISRCKAALGAAMARDEYEGGFYNRGATLSGAVEHPSQLSDTAIKHLKDSVNALYGGSDKSHQVGVFEEGATFRTIGSPLKDLEFVAAQQMSRTDIATMFKLPPNYLGGASGDSLTYATVESNQIQFALHAISPITSAITKALTADSGIFPQNIFDCEFVLDGMLRADAGARASYYQTMSSIGAITPNEIRKLENLPPIPGGDTPALPTQERVTISEQAPVLAADVSTADRQPPAAPAQPKPVGSPPPRRPQLVP